MRDSALPLHDAAGFDVRALKGLPCTVSHHQGYRMFRTAVAGPRSLRQPTPAEQISTQNHYCFIASSSQQLAPPL